MAYETEISEGTTRRGLLSWFLMGVGLVAGYGAGALHFFQYLVPLRRKGRRREMFIGTMEDLPLGTTRTVRDPRGQEIIVARIAENPNEPGKDFRALSTKCPHLGCKVHWEAGAERFRCPCHEGIFDRNGVAVSGPPAQEKKNLIEYDVRVDARTRWVYVMVSEDSPYGA